MLPVPVRGMCVLTIIIAMSTPQLSALETNALADFAGRTRARFGPRLVDLRLFGSRARGEGHAESDLDLLVLVDGLTRDERREVQDLAFDVGCAAKLVLSPLAQDSRQWRQDLPLAIAIDREGVAL